MSVARQRRKSVRKISAIALDSTAVLATDIDAVDNMRSGMIAAPRKVVVTERVSIKRTFSAPRIDMGEYSPCSTHALEAVKYLAG